MLEGIGCLAFVAFLLLVLFAMEGDWLIFSLVIEPACLLGEAIVLGASYLWRKIT